MNADCTFNLVRNGYARSSFGCRTIRRNEKGDCAHQYRPFSYLLSRTERGDGYALLFKSTANTLNQYENGFILTMRTFTSDHHDGLINAARAEFIGSLYLIHCMITLIYDRNRYNNFALLAAHKDWWISWSKKQI
jgi:hypothetical protein